jgi:hypothetical protein
MTTLFETLQAAGLPVMSVDERGAVPVIAMGIMTMEQQAQFGDVLTQYSNAAGYNAILAVRNRQLGAKAIAKNIPNWAAWSQQDWSNYFNTNLSDTEIDAQVATISSLATAKTVMALIMKRQNKILDALAKMEIALRDQVWPDLPE